MSLLDRVQQDLMAAMKAQEKTKTGALRMLKAALKNAEIEAGKLDESAEVKVLQRMVNQRRESIEMFEKNGRQELADNEKAELAIVETYLPTMVSEAEIEALVDEVVGKNPGVGPKQMGQITGQVMKALAGKPVDGKLVSAKVKAKLGA